MKRLFSSLLRPGLLGGLLLALSAPVSRADFISDWNSQILGAISAEGELGPDAARSLAMLNVAIYNAVEGIAGDYYVFSNGSYSGPSATAPDGASMEAAVAAAAHTILQSLYASQGGNFATLYSTQLSSIADSQAKIDGINFGTVVANDILNWRNPNVDGANAAAGTPYTPVGSIGYWQPPSSAALPGWGNVTTFGINSASVYSGNLFGGMSRNDYLASAAYAADYNQVKSIGVSTGGTRTNAQSDAANFWASPTGTVTTAGIWTEVAQTVAASAGLNLQDSARLYASLNVAMADAAIATWQTKYDIDFWSPLQAIIDGDNDGNALTVGDINWSAYLAELDSPNYFSEQSALSAAAAHVLISFFGDNVSFTVNIDIDGDGILDGPRTFNSFSEAATEAGLSQIWGGTSYGTANTDAANAGNAVAIEVLNNNFAPVPEPSGMVLVMIGSTLLMVRRRRTK